MANVERILIIGGVAGGASAAARARRLSESAEIVIFERGPHISFANCGLPYHIGGAISERERLLVQTPEGMRKRFRIDVRVRTEVVKIDAQRKEVVARNLATGAETTERYDKLILSPGAEPVRPPIPGINGPRVFVLRGMGDMDAIKGALGLDSKATQARPDRALVIGGGYIGLEMVEALRQRGLAVTLVELTHQVMPPADAEMAHPLHQQLKHHNVDLRLGASVTSLHDDGRIVHAQLSTGESVACGIVIVAVGVRPDTKLAAEADLKLSDRGAIVVDHHMRSSIPDIFAVGDAVEVTDFVGGFPTLIPLAGPASRQGRIAADNAMGRSSVYGKTQGTAICKVFDLAIGMTGLSEKALKRAGRTYEKVYVHPASHASYYPGAQPISLKLLFDPKDGQILGAQAVGAAGVDKRIDVLAVAIRGGMTVFDLEEMELSYAPPFGSAKDPINYAGFVAANALRGDVKLCHTEDMLSPRDGQQLLDVRTPAEVAAGTIPGAVNIPLDELRGRLGELPQNRELLVFCQVGLRGYLACRILSQHGFACRNMTGGYKTYAAAVSAIPQGGARQPASSKDSRPTSPKEEMRSDTGATSAVPAAPPATGAKPVSLKAVRHIDARGLQCPGPIIRLKDELDKMAPGEAVMITVNDHGFAADIKGWCHSTGHELAELGPENGETCATIVKRIEGAAPACSVTPCKNKTIVVFSNDLDRVMAAFIIANGAATMGSDVTLFFTFWGLNVLRKPEAVPVRKSIMETMFGWMMPRGALKLSLSKMNMAGVGTRMMKGIMKSKNVASLPDLMANALRNHVRLVACSMSMGVMGIKREELIEGVEEGGVAMYLDHAEAGNVNLFI
jgi:NADPH-dependent 2,4-dienoyl-CoA reductase/sulfur reductase-like enzyme/peroxiredoxin family protein/rhodanese-related sulfurtransferase/TusA-related sulfurtransferase